MSLIDRNKTEAIEVDGDWYKIRRDISFYEEAQIRLAGMNMRDITNPGAQTAK